MILSPLGAIAKKKKFHRNLAICLSYTFILVAPVYSQSGIRNDYTVDYEGVDCSKSYTVTNNDVYTLVATPRQDVETGLTFCRNQFVAPDGRTLKIYVIDLKIGSCGVTIKIYDNDPNMVREPRWSLGCRGSTEQLQSYSKTIIVRLQKPTADSTSLYNFKLVVTTDQGPTINVEDYQTMDGGGASSGVIAGIGIAAGLVVVVIVVVIAVVYCRYAKRKEEEKYQQKPSSVFSTTTSQSLPNAPQGILKRTDSKGKGSQRRQNRRAVNGGYQNKAYSGSMDGESDFSKVESQTDDFDSFDYQHNDIDLEYENEQRRNERGSVGRRSRPRATRGSNRDSGDSVFVNDAYQDDNGVIVQPPRKSYLEESSSDGTWTGQKVSYKPDPSRRRSDSPSRSSRGSSTETEGQVRYIRNEEGRRRSQRKRSNSRSSKNSVISKTSQATSNATTATAGTASTHAHSHSHSHHGHRSHSSGGSHGRRSRSRSRERQKKADAMLPIFAENKKQKRRH